MDKQLFFNYMYNAVLFFYSQIQPHLHLVNKLMTKEHNWATNKETIYENSNSLYNTV